MKMEGEERWYTLNDRVAFRDTEALANPARQSIKDVLGMADMSTYQGRARS